MLNKQSFVVAYIWILSILFLALDILYQLAQVGVRHITNLGLVIN